MRQGGGRGAGGTAGPSNNYSPSNWPSGDFFTINLAAQFVNYNQGNGAAVHQPVYKHGNGRLCL